MNYFYISATNRSSGKTVISIGLSRLLKDQGVQLQCFKKGPDYIDPLWLSAASGRPCYNLDPWIESIRTSRQKFQHHMQEGVDIGLIEGNMGLFDGVSEDGADSNAAVAKSLKAPVLLIINTSGMTRSIAPLLQGYVNFDPELNIKAVILNQVASNRHERKLVASVENYTDLKILGAVYRSKSLDIRERHLGLTPVNEHEKAEEIIQRIADTIKNEVNLDEVKALAPTQKIIKSTPYFPSKNKSNGTGLRIGIAMDAAFGFYYADDLDAFRHTGVELVPVNMLRDTGLPESIDGLFIGGGFPEFYMGALEANQAMRLSVKSYIESNMPVYAECGGLIYLARSLTWNGKSCKMCGAIKADVIMKTKPQGRGYVMLEETDQHLWPSNREVAKLRAHEFHHSRLENLAKNTEFAYRVKRGYGINGHDDGIVIKNTLACYSHLRQGEANHWVDRFVAFVKQLKETRKAG